MSLLAWRQIVIGIRTILGRKRRDGRPLGETKGTGTVKSCFDKTTYKTRRGAFLSTFFSET
jgi:hypothetical protein